jgi:hypothetical protein
MAAAHTRSRIPISHQINITLRNLLRTPDLPQQRHLLHRLSFFLLVL